MSQNITHHHKTLPKNQAAIATTKKYHSKHFVYIYCVSDQVRPSHIGASLANNDGLCRFKALFKQNARTRIFVASPDLVSGVYILLNSKQSVHIFTSILILCCCVCLLPHTPNIYCNVMQTTRYY